VRTGRSVAARQDVNESLREAAQLLRPWADQHGVELRLDLAEKLPTLLAVGDELRLAFFNLGANAIQSCDEGGRVSLQSEAGGSGIRITVQDDGRGMSDEEQARAFDPFYSRRENLAGTGLGLTLCHGIVADHDGKIDVDSHPGAGTRVTVELPIERDRRG
ncbi:MAG: sensor histidine kinase, partial [Myxococcota bacterium]